MTGHDDALLVPGWALFVEPPPCCHTLLPGSHTARTERSEGVLLRGTLAASGEARVSTTDGGGPCLQEVPAALCGLWDQRQDAMAQTPGLAQESCTAAMDGPPS